jgi:hypothetical protein
MEIFLLLVWFLFCCFDYMFYIKAEIPEPKPDLLWSGGGIIAYFKFGPRKQR